MRYSIHDKTLAAKKARILINALIDCAKAGIKSSFVIKKMLLGISLYLECGSCTEENCKRKVTFEHARPLGVMYQMFLAERTTLTLERAAFIIGKYPPVLITME